MAPTHVNDDDPEAGVRGGKPKAFTARITSALRSALDEEAIRSGRTVGQVAQEWMDQARAGRASVDEILGGISVAPALREMARHARVIVETFGAPSDNLGSRLAILATWQVIAEHLVSTPLLSSDDLKLREAVAAGDEKAAGKLLTGESVKLERARKTAELIAAGLKAQYAPDEFRDRNLEAIAKARTEQAAADPGRT